MLTDASGYAMAAFWVGDYEALRRGSRSAGLTGFRSFGMCLEERRNTYRNKKRDLWGNPKLCETPHMEHYCPCSRPATSDS